MNASTFYNACSFLKRGTKHGTDVVRHCSAKLPRSMNSGRSCHSRTSSLGRIRNLTLQPRQRHDAPRTTSSTDRILTTHRQNEDLRRHLLRSQDLSRQGKRTSPYLHPSRSRALGGLWRQKRGLKERTHGYTFVASGGCMLLFGRKRRELSATRIHAQAHTSRLGWDFGRNICSALVLTYILQGKLFVRSDSKIFRFQNGKSESLFLQRKNPRKIAWTVLCRRQRRKGISEVRNHNRRIHLESRPNHILTTTTGGCQDPPSPPGQVPACHRWCFP